MARGYLAGDEALARFRRERQSVAAWRAGDALGNLTRTAQPALALLEAGRIYPPRLGLGTVQGGLAAAFQVMDWTITASADEYGKSLDAVGARRQASALYHEARHVEQFFLAAIMLTWKGQQSDAQKRLLEGLPSAVMSAAVDSKIGLAENDLPEIASWIESYWKVPEVMRRLYRARQEVDSAGSRIVLWGPSAGEAIRGQEDLERRTAEAEDLERAADASRKSLVSALAAYVGLAHEVDAYWVSAAVDWPAPSGQVGHERDVAGPLREGLTAFRAATDAYYRSQPSAE